MCFSSHHLTTKQPHYFDIKILSSNMYSKTNSKYIKKKSCLSMQYIIK